nr:PIN domain-containing protein [Corallococcus exiguus]
MDGPPEPIHVLLDTSLLRSEVSAQGSGLRHLKSSVEKGVVRVLVPDLVLRELATGMATDFKAWVNKARQEPQRALSWCMPGSETEGANAGLAALTAVLPQIDQLLTDGVTQRMKELKAKILPVTEKAARAAWDMYFAGSGPMKQVKSRADIPDAFIVACAMEAQAKLGKRVHIIAGDVALKKAFPKREFVLHDSLGEFNSSDAVKAALQSLEERANAVAYEHWRGRVRDALAEQFDSIESGVRDALWAALHNKEVISHYLPSSNGEGRLEGDGSLDGLELHWAKVDDLGRGAVVIPVTLHVVDALVEVFIDKSDYWHDDEVSTHFKAYDANWDDHSIAAHGYLELLVEAVIRVDLEEDEYEEIIVTTASIEEVKSIEMKEPDWFSASTEAATHEDEAQAGDDGPSDEQPTKEEGQPKGPELKKDGEPTGGQ